MSVVKVHLRTMITDRNGNDVDLENLERYIGETLVFKIVQADTNRVVKEYEIILKWRRSEEYEKSNS